MAIIKNIIFDLDDTLFDTYGLLVKPASMEAFQVMIEKGLNATTKACMQAHADFKKNNIRENVFLKIAEHFGSKGDIKTSVLARAGENAFLKRSIKENIKLFPQTKEVLKKLKSHYRLILLTIGDIQTQQTKINLLELDGIFNETIIVDVSSEKDKNSSFKNILTQSNLKPENFVSIGNRIDTDIAFAKTLGMKGVLFEHGEYLHLKPQNEFERPDHIVKNLKEFEEWLAHAG
ncbi:MAG: HAD family hydrolase [Oligoflexia bacterium]|nr:HAD family hydrolase [Oligoflexia bacterium]